MKTIEKINKTLAEYGLGEIPESDYGNPALLEAIKGYGGGGIESVSIALNVLGRKADAKIIVHKSFNSDRTWESQNSFEERLDLLAENGGEKLVSEIIKKGLKKGYIDRTCTAALKYGNMDDTKMLAEMRMNEVLSGKAFADEIKDETGNSLHFAAKLYEKLKMPEEIKKAVDYCLAKKEYFYAKKPAGIKFKIDGNQGELNKACALFKEYSFIRDMVMPPNVEVLSGCEGSDSLVCSERTVDGKTVTEILGVLPHISMLVINPEKSALKEARKTAKDVLDSLPKEEYEKPVNFEVGGNNGLKIFEYTGVDDCNDNLIYAYPTIKGTVFDVGIKTSDEYRLKIGVFKSNSSASSDVFVGGSKTISPENMKAETKEIGERMAGLQKDMELRFSERFDDENMKHINDVLSLKMLLVKNVKFLTAYDAVECDVRNAGGVENYKDRLRLAGFNESLIGKVLEYAGTE